MDTKINKANQKLKAFELVLMGHPDKVCDLVSKTICDLNKGNRNAIECMWGNKLFVVSGETDKQWTDEELEKVVKDVLVKEIGLTKSEANSIKVINNLNIQSPEINAIVGDSGTGDNGIYFGGYHKVYSPVIAKMKEMCNALTAKVLKDWGYRTDGKFIFHVNPKGKITDLTLNIASSAKGMHDTTALIAFIHTFTGSDTSIIINPKGDWHKCFGFADCGLTGRKLACDGTCGLFSHGGGAMFGKDLSKADVTIPLYLSLLAKNNIGKKKVCTFSASSIIGDNNVDVYKDGKYWANISFNAMKSLITSGELDLFGHFEGAGLDY